MVVAHRLSCSAAYGIFPDQGSKPSLWHWQADSLPPSHQGSPAPGLSCSVWDLLVAAHKLQPRVLHCPWWECSSPSGPHWRPCSASSTLLFAAFTLLFYPPCQCFSDVHQTVWRACDNTEYCTLFLELPSQQVPGRSRASDFLTPALTSCRWWRCSWPRDHALCYLQA